MFTIVFICLLFLALFDDSDNRAFYLFLMVLLVLFK